MTTAQEAGGYNISHSMSNGKHAIMSLTRIIIMTFGSNTSFITGGKAKYYEFRRPQKLSQLV